MTGLTREHVIAAACGFALGAITVLDLFACLWWLAATILMF